MRLRAVVNASSTVTAKRCSVLDLVVIGLHGLDLAEGLGHVAAHIGDTVLAQARQAAHATAEDQDRRQHQRQRHHHDAGELGVGDEQQHDAADHHQCIAQEQRQRRADHRLQQGGVGGQPRLDFRAAVVLVETWVQVDQVVEDLPANVRHHPFTDPRHQVKPRKRAHGQAQHQHHEQADGLVEQVRRLGHEALVHQQANALPHGQGDAGGDDQREQGTDGLPAVGRDEAAGQANCTALTD